VLQLDAVDMPVNHRCTFVIDNSSDSGTPASGDVTMDAGEVLVDPEDPRRVPANVFDVKMGLV